MDGNELRERRQALGLSQRGLAQRFRVPWTTISRCETGAVTLREPRVTWLEVKLSQLEQERGQD